MKVFVEEQRFKNWFILPIIALPIIGMIVIFMQDQNGIPTVGSEKFWGITISCTVLLAVVILIISMNLVTKIDEKGVHYQFYPIHFGKKFISWSEIDKCYLRKYNAIREFNGYGYRIRPFGKNRGLAINVGGKYGIQLEMKSGKRLLIGTQKEMEVEKILKTYKEKFQLNGE